MTPEQDRKKRRLLALVEEKLDRLIHEHFYGNFSFDGSMQDGTIANASWGVKRTLPLKIPDNKS